MARDATARLYDVDANTIELDKKIGLITFQAKKGRLVNLDKLHESIWATRLGDRTGMELFVLEVTTHGKAELKGDQLVLSIPGSDRQFILKADPKVQPKNGKKSPYQNLRGMLEDGPQEVAVTGRVEGWQGNFTKFLAKLPGQPRRILVTEFQVDQ